MHRYILHSLILKHTTDTHTHAVFVFHNVSSQPLRQQAGLLGGEGGCQQNMRQVSFLCCLNTGSLSYSDSWVNHCCVQKLKCECFQKRQWEGERERVPQGHSQVSGMQMMSGFAVVTMRSGRAMLPLLSKQETDDSSSHNLSFDNPATMVNQNKYSQRIFTF